MAFAMEMASMKPRIEMMMAAGMRRGRRARLSRVTGARKLGSPFGIVPTTGVDTDFAIAGGNSSGAFAIDTQSGRGSSKLESVTILAETAMTADALATAVSVMGHEKGLALIESLPDIEAIVIDADGVTLNQTSGANTYID